MTGEDRLKMLRAKLHIADMLDAGVTLQWIREGIGLSKRRFDWFIKDQRPMTTFLPSVADHALALDLDQGVDESATMGAWNGKMSAKWRTLASEGLRRFVVEEQERMRKEAIQGTQDEEGLVRPSDRKGARPRRSLVLGERRRTLARTTPLSMLALPSPAKATVWMVGPSEEGAEAPVPGLTKEPPTPPPVAEPAERPALPVDRIPALPKRVDMGGLIGIALSKTYGDAVEAGLRSATDAELAPVLGCEADEVTAWRVGNHMPLARCKACQDRLIAKGRTAYCDECAFDAHEALRLRMRSGSPSTQREAPDEEGEPVSDHPDAKASRYVPMPESVGQAMTTPTRESCQECGGALGVRRQTCRPCAFEAFLVMCDRMRQAGMEVA